MLTALIALALVAALGGGLFLSQAKFGARPAGQRLERVQRSPHYQNGRFQNLIPTTTQTDGVGFWEMWTEFLRKKERLAPAQPLPSVGTDLAALFSGPEPGPDRLIWFGHSSFLMRLGGKNILIDPVFSDHASPFSFTTKAFAGTNLYSPGDLPPIDYLLISHDHWDHLDYPTVVALKGRVGRVVCGLGVGAHFERWGFPPEKIIEGDWYDRLELSPELTLHFMPARHFSGRGLKWNQSLWTAFVLESPDRRVFYSGDTGPGPHLADIGRRFDGFDLAIIEAGQYDRQWAYIHLSPPEVADAADRLRAKVLMPMHNGKFSIANHPWDEPFIRLADLSREADWRLATPLIGQALELDQLDHDYDQWWAGLK